MTGQAPGAALRDAASDAARTGTASVVWDAARATSRLLR